MDLSPWAGFSLCEHRSHEAATLTPGLEMTPSGAANLPFAWASNSATDTASEDPPPQAVFGHALQKMEVIE